MEIYHKRIDFLGDSITYGFKTSSEDKRFTDIIRQKAGAYTLNYGINGTKLAKTDKLDPTRYKRLDMCGRVKCMNALAKFVCVFGGTNDFGYGIPVGSFEDTTAYTYYGALHKTYSEIRKYVPHAQIIFFTPLHRESEVTKPVNSAGNTLSDYVDAVKKVAEHYGCPVLDLYNENKFDLRKEEDRKLYGEDGLHPNDAGHAVLADEIIEFFEKL